MAKKMCKLCGKSPATVPDRQRMGRMLNSVCAQCHSQRLVGDLRAILESAEKRPPAESAQEAQA